MDPLSHVASGWASQSQALHCAKLSNPEVHDVFTKRPEIESQLCCDATLEEKGYLHTSMNPLQEVWFTTLTIFVKEGEYSAL